jgi:hypothetical protein
LNELNPAINQYSITITPEDGYIINGKNEAIESTPFIAMDNLLIQKRTPAKEISKEEILAFTPGVMNETNLELINRMFAVGGDTSQPLITMELAKSFSVTLYSVNPTTNKYSITLKASEGFTIN